MSKRFRLMGYVLIISLFLISSASAQEVITPEGPPGRDSDFVSDQILVRFQPWVGSQRAAQLISERGLTQKRKIDILEIHVLHLPPGLTVERAVEIYSRLPEVEYAEPNYILHAVGPTQQEIDDQWGLQTIEAPRAWDKIDPKISVPIAIVDTGIDPNHTDLATNIWNNTEEILGNGIDDDNNGAIDDSWGWDFVNNDDDPFDDNMHGTAVSSVAAGVQDGDGVAGVCPWCQVIAVKVLDAYGSGTLDVVATGIRYAADSRAKVINLSLGATTGAQALQDAVDYAWGKGTLVVAAAGNNGIETLFYPAAYTNAIAVTATNDQDYRACFSNYGDNFIDVAAPGEAIYHAAPNQTFETNSGTSVAAPHVAGLGGLLFSQDGSRTHDEVRTLIETTTEDLGPAGTDPYFGTGRINAYRAVMNNTDPTTPPTGWFVTDLSSSGYAHARKLVRAGGNLHMVYHSQNFTNDNYQVLYTVSSNNGATWTPPEVVFESPAETYHAALATDDSNLFLAFPSMQGGPNYSVYFTRKSLPDGDWTPPETLMGGTYNAVRPDLYYDASTGVLHLVGSSYDDAGVVYYTNSGDRGSNWSEIVNVSTGGSLQNSRYASVHAYGETVTIAGRSVELWFGIAPYFRVFTTQSLNNGTNWGSPIIHSEVLGLLANEYGLSLAGQGDELRLVYEHSGDINFRTSTGGASWTTWETIGNGAWPTITQAGDGQIWAMWVNGGVLQLRHNVGGVWDPVQALDTGEYPNLMLPPENDRIEWAATQCSGAPFRMSYGYELIDVSENNPPVADDQSVTTLEDTEISITLTAGDPDGDPLTYVLVDIPTYGVLSGTPPNMTYMPDGNYNGPDSFTFKANDGLVDSNIATVSITVSAVNDPPVANGQSPTTLEDTPVDITLTGSDVETAVLTYAIDVDPEHGTLTGTEPNLTYTPDQDYNSTDSFTFTAYDGTDYSNIATVSITISPVNDPPVTEGQSVTTDEDVPVVIPKTATDVDDTSFTFQLESEPSHGDLTDGLTYWTYTPEQDYNGTDSFSFTANDGEDDSNIATVSITLDPVNDRPVAYPQTVSTDEDTPIIITLTGSDVEGSQLEYNVVAGPAHGSLSPSGQVRTYNPALNFAGSDSFSFLVNDGTLDSEIVVVNIQVGSVNDPPVADDQSVSTPVDTPLDITLTGSDVESTNLSFTHGSPSNGSLNGTPPNLTYTPEPGYTGPDSFTFTVTDGDGASDTGTVSITVVAGTMHIGDLDGWVSYSKATWTAHVTILVHDGGEGAVQGATVHGTWDGSAIEATCTTGLEGTCTIDNEKIHKRYENTIFTVTDVTNSSRSYQAGDNHDPDGGDSSGTAIQVNQDNTTQDPSNTPPVASFTYGCVDLLCTFDASGSSDPDGSIVFYRWDFGDENTATGTTADHTYAAAGTYSVVLTVTDDGNASDTETQAVSPDQTASTLHVGDLDNLSQTTKNRWNAAVLVIVHNQDHDNVGGVKVDGIWDGGIQGTASCNTTEQGQCLITKSNLKLNIPGVTFTITNLTHGADIYDPYSNHDPDADDDSDGTTISVFPN